MTSSYIAWHLCHWYSVLTSATTYVPGWAVEPKALAAGEKTNEEKRKRKSYSA